MLNSKDMLLFMLLIVPLSGALIIPNIYNIKNIKIIGLIISLVNLIVSFFIFLIFDSNNNQFQLVHITFNFNLGVDGISIYFILLTTMLISVSILSNWKSIIDFKNYIIIILLLETILIFIFMVLDIFYFYVFFESILLPFFIYIGLFGSDNKERASFYLFLYTLLGSLFLLLSILYISSNTGTTDLNLLEKSNFEYVIQIFLFYRYFYSFCS